MLPRKTKNPGGEAGADTGKKAHNPTTANVTTFDNKSKYQKAFDRTLTKAALLNFGIVTLRFHIEDGRLVRYVIAAEESFLSGER
jgi:hypothetical protein